MTRRKEQLIAFIDSLNENNELEAFYHLSIYDGVEFFTIHSAWSNNYKLRQVELKPQEEGHAFEHVYIQLQERWQAGEFRSEYRVPLLPKRSGLSFTWFSKETVGLAFFTAYSPKMPCYIFDILFRKTQMPHTYTLIKPWLPEDPLSYEIRALLTELKKSIVSSTIKLRNFKGV